MRGKFITIEGCEGAGKSTQIAKLRDYYAASDLPVFFTREPGGTAISERIRRIILDPSCSQMDAITELMLYAASRRQLTKEVIVDKLEQGITVFCDRYIDSTTAYQGFGRGLDLDIIYNLNKWAMADVEIDLTLFLDVPPERGFFRKSDQSKLDRLEQEKLEFHKNVYKGYQWLSSSFPQRIAIVNGLQRREDVFKDILLTLQKRGIPVTK